jgi:hypothetical protein
MPKHLKTHTNTYTHTLKYIITSREKRFTPSPVWACLKSHVSGVEERHKRARMQIEHICYNPQKSNFKFRRQSAVCKCPTLTPT